MLSGHQGIKVAGNIWYGECPKKKRLFAQKLWRINTDKEYALKQPPSMKKLK